MMVMAMVCLTNPTNALILQVELMLELMDAIIRLRVMFRTMMELEILLVWNQNYQWELEVHRVHSVCLQALTNS